MGYLGTWLAPLPPMAMVRVDWRALGLGLVTTCLLGAAALRGGYLQESSVGPRRRVVAASELQVVDGDTVRWRGQELRFLAVDTPERGAPWFDGDQQPWAGRAASLVRAELDAAQDVVLLDRGRRDVYGRPLVHLLVDGEPLAVKLVEAGLAFPTVARYGDQGFPEIAARVLARARTPQFERPWRWRRGHRVEPAPK